MSLILWNRMPLDTKNLITEYATGMVLWELLGYNMDRPDASYSVTPFEDRWWDITAMGDSDESLFEEHIFHALECHLIGFAHCVGEMLNDFAPTDGFQTHWMSGVELVDRKVAISCFGASLNMLTEEIGEHTCKKIGFAVPTKLQWWMRTFPNKQYYSTVKAIQQLRKGSFEATIFKVILKDFDFE